MDTTEIDVPDDLRVVLSTNYFDPARDMTRLNGHPENEVGLWLAENCDPYSYGTLQMYRSEMTFWFLNATEAMAFKMRFG